jgi:hypothetical protein
MKSFLIGALGATLFMMYACTGAKPEGEDAATAAADTTATPPAEFADPKYAQTARAAQDLFAAGDIAGWAEQFADNAVYAWNTGDSLAGKAAISEYWTKRRAEVIDSISFTDHIYLPIQVNTPQSVEAPGVWLLTWYRTYARYTSGKTMQQWMHADLHYNADGKVDRIIHYMDRSAIQSAEK